MAEVRVRLPLDALAHGRGPIHKVVPLGGQRVSKTRGVGSIPTDLAPVPGTAGHPKRMPCDAAGVAVRLSNGRDGFESRTGR